MRYTHVESPIDRLLLVGEPGVLSGLYVADHDGCRALDPTWVEDASAFTEVIGQLEEYFAGERTEFDLQLEPHGTPFQLDVWAALQEIPYGETMGYGELARRIGRPTASRAVGAANGRNPISILIPCHRVIGADGSLTGYGWGTTRKSWLLDHERAAGRLFA
jgi:methylated-DNA-[protein]-cysteine S-methyltransferase